MAIREDIVSSAAAFLQDPSVASSSVENRVAFLRSKNLTQEEINAAMSRVGGAPPPPPPSQSYQSAPPQYYQQYPPNAWQPPPPPPRRDWRDYFIMATVVGGVGYGLYSLGKRYVMPLVAPPTPEKLEQDKKSIEEQFDRAFSLVEQLAKDTEELKATEQQRTERLDTALSQFESVMSELISANKRREDDAQRIRDEVQALKDAIPKALNTQKDQADSRLKEINTELGSLKTLMSQRMTAAAPQAPAPAAPQPVAAKQPLPASVSPAPPSPTINASSSTPATPAAETPKPSFTSFGRPLNGNASGKASIPAWQKAAMSNADKDTSSSSGEASKENEASASAS